MFIQMDSREIRRLKAQLELLALAAQITETEYHAEECSGCGVRFDSDGRTWPCCPRCYQVSRSWLRSLDIDPDAARGGYAPAT